MLNDSFKKAIWWEMSSACITDATFTQDHKSVRSGIKVLWCVCIVHVQVFVIKPGQICVPLLL